MDLEALPGNAMMIDLTDRVTTNPRRCAGHPCIRETCIRVIDVLSLLATGMSNEQVLAEMPELELEDIFASLQFAIRRTQAQAMDA